MATIFVFASSLFVTSILVLLKAIELRFNKQNIFLRLLCKLDNKATSAINNVKFRTLQLIQTVRYVLLVKSEEMFRNVFYRMEERLVNQYKMRHDSVMGRKTLINKGAVSFYLKKIAEDRGVMERGKIE